MTPYSLSIYDTDRAYLVGWVDLDCPLAEALDKVRRHVKGAALYKVGRGKMQPIPLATEPTTE